MANFVKGVVIALFLIGGFGTWAYGMARWDDPPRSPKAWQYVTATQLAGVLFIFGLGLANFPIAKGRRSSEPVPEPEPGPPPVEVAWHRATLVANEPDDVPFVAPASCPCCGSEEVAWTVPIAGQRRGAAGLGIAAHMLGPVGAVAAHAIDSAQTRWFQVSVCEAAHRLEHAREVSRVLLTAGWVAPATVAIVSGLADVWPLWLVLAASVVGGAGALLFHHRRFEGRRAKPESLTLGYGVKAKLGKSLFSISESSAVYTLQVQACDPIWIRELVERNRRVAKITLEDEVALADHEQALRSARLR